MKLASMILFAAALFAGRDGRHDDHDWDRHNPPPVATPEPATYATIAIGLGAIIAISQRRKHR